MCRRCKDGNAVEPKYSEVEVRVSLDQWMEWAVPKYDEFLLNNPEGKPSVSRFGDKGHYEIGNIEIIDFKKNLQLQKSIKNMIELKCPFCYKIFHKARNHTHLIKKNTCTTCSKQCGGKMSQLKRYDIKEYNKRVDNSVIREYKVYRNFDLDP